MKQRDDHTWELVLDYRQCPKCGFIIENREGFHYQMGAWIKEIVCERCNHPFTVKDKHKTTFGPLIGMPQPPEIAWEEK